MNVEAAVRATHVVQDAARTAMLIQLRDIDSAVLEDIVTLARYDDARMENIVADHAELILHERSRFA